MFDFAASALEVDLDLLLLDHLGVVGTGLGVSVSRVAEYLPSAFVLVCRVLGVGGRVPDHDGALLLALLLEVRTVLGLLVRGRGLDLAAEGGFLVVRVVRVIRALVEVQGDLGVELGLPPCFSPFPPPPPARATPPNASVAIATAIVNSFVMYLPLGKLAYGTPSCSLIHHYLRQARRFPDKAWRRSYPLRALPSVVLEGVERGLLLAVVEEGPASGRCVRPQS